MKYPRYRFEQTWYNIVTPPLFVLPLAWMIGVWFMHGEMGAKIAGFLATILVWPLVASVLLGPVGPFLTYANRFDQFKRANPEASAEDCDAAGMRAVSRCCNCPNFVTNLDLPHVSDCPRYGEARRR